MGKNSKINKITTAKGFTLIEVLVALSIFAVIAVITTVGLRTVISTYRKVSTVDERLRQILMVTVVMRQDLSQMIDRAIVDSGSKIASLYIPNKSTLEFTRAGFTNPMGRLNRSSLQRVEYTITGNDLMRNTWVALDRTAKTTKRTIVLLGKVKSLYISYVNSAGKIVDSWSTNTLHQDIFPQAIIVDLELEKMGKLKIEVPITGRGYEIQ